MCFLDNLHSAMVLENIDRYPGSGASRLPAWAVTEHYENCEGGLRNFVRRMLGR